MKLLIKEPGEALTHQPTFGGVTTIQSLTSIDVSSRGLVAGSQMIGVAHVLFAQALTLTITGGTHAERYLIDIDVVDAGATPRNEQIEVLVLDQGWTMPDGSAPMISIKTFVAAFGLEEVVRMTDDVGNGLIGKDMLVGALVYAQGLTVAHLDRYSLPLDSVPVFLEMAIADIARGRLYPNGAPEGVTANASRAFKTLERIQSGQLPIPGAVAAGEQAGGDGPVVFHSGGRTYPDGLAGYRSGR